MTRAVAWLTGQPFLLLVLTMLMWGANAVAGRLAIGEVSPMLLTTLRWLIAAAILAAVARRQVRRDWPTLRANAGRLAWMGALGYTGFSALLYQAALYTTAVNITILQGAMPAFVMVGALLAYGVRIAPPQALGVAVAIVGVVTLASRGDLAVLRTLAFNRGDVLMLIAGLAYSAYTLALRRRPPVHGLSLFVALAVAALIATLPLLAIEAWAGRMQWPTPFGWAVVAFVGLFPSLLAQLMFIRAVEIVGPARAGPFLNLTPVFGAILGVAVLGEPFGLYSAVALALVIGGILIAERSGRAAPSS